MNKLIDTGAVAAAYCVADESIDAFRRFHAALYAQQPEETSASLREFVCRPATQRSIKFAAVTCVIRRLRRVPVT